MDDSCMFPPTIATKVYLPPSSLNFLDEAWDVWVAQSVSRSRVGIFLDVCVSFFRRSRHTKAFCVAVSRVPSRFTGFWHIYCSRIDSNEIKLLFYTDSSYLSTHSLSAVKDCYYIVPTYGYRALSLWLMFYNDTTFCTHSLRAVLIVITLYLHKAIELCHIG